MIHFMSVSSQRFCRLTWKQLGEERTIQISSSTFRERRGLSWSEVGPSGACPSVQRNDANAGEVVVFTFYMAGGGRGWGG